MVSVAGILDPTASATSAGASSASARLTVDGKTPKAVVSDDEGSDSDSEAEEARTASMGEQGDDDDGGSEGDTDDAPARSSSRNNRVRPVCSFDV